MITVAMTIVEGGHHREIRWKICNKTDLDEIYSVIGCLETNSLHGTTRSYPPAERGTRMIDQSKGLDLHIAGSAVTIYGARYPNYFAAQVWDEDMLLESIAMRTRK